MLVLINGNVYDSDKTPIMILFSQEEIVAFKKEPDNIDIHCSFPKDWGINRGQQWMNQNKELLIKNKNKPKRVSDDQIKKMLSKDNNPFDFDSIFNERTRND